MIVHGEGVIVQRLPVSRLVFDHYLAPPLAQDGLARRNARAFRQKKPLCVPEKSLRLDTSSPSPCPLCIFNLTDLIRGSARVRKNRRARACAPRNVYARRQPAQCWRGSSERGGQREGEREREREGEREREKKRVSERKRGRESAREKERQSRRQLRATGEIRGRRVRRACTRSADRDSPERGSDCECTHADWIPWLFY